MNGKAWFRVVQPTDAENNGRRQRHSEGLATEASGKCTDRRWVLPDLLEHRYGRREKAKSHAAPGFAELYRNLETAAHRE